MAPSPKKRAAPKGRVMAQKKKKEAPQISPEDTVIIQFVSADGVGTGSELSLPLNTDRAELQSLLKELLLSDIEQAPKNEELRDEIQDTDYSFVLNDSTQEVSSTLHAAWTALEAQPSAEQTLRVRYHPLARFRVRPVTRCTSSMTGHTDSVLCAAFSPDGSKLATGSGDCTVRLWDLFTETPAHTCKGHASWVLLVAWSGDGKRLLSAGMDKTAIVWDGAKGQKLGTLKGHTGPITCGTWQPFHLLADGQLVPNIATGSKDMSIRVWSGANHTVLFVLTSHTAPVTCLRWTGEDYIISGSRDRVLKAWSTKDGRMLREFKGHAHWVNTVCCNTDYVTLKTGCFGEKDQPATAETTVAELKERALQRYNKMIQRTGGVGERILSGSDDFTMFLWSMDSKKPLCRLTGHQKLVNNVQFSPDGRMIASASFDKSVRLWDGVTGKFICALRGHVADVYMVSWSADSRMLVSGSKDSTVKVWDAAKRKLKEDLPGHADEVFAVDWSGDGARVVSAGRDKVVKIWKH
ncbi:Notchless protein 1 [Perkinsus olseni]|uniref:Notchless protein 1 n=3 Tax=Perkinsus olseni TaxID=32597 RepID=A0A7J6LM43_PEROL|nr:Notchless protein 1 [Perkinsus olseni]KAF4665211.1 Notchless protein 1 [Perkinsus olseni]